jgi:hypothetical protein
MSGNDRLPAIIPRFSWGDDCTLKSNLKKPAKAILRDQKFFMFLALMLDSIHGFIGG